ncbi:flavodoxin family protein [Microbulbifer elongatus]|uniref:flavodoxin family protein n=1 Tax=Microbulbifer elongatus TaxID=86173 RepID=UPI001CFD33E7|nr:flavodoxin family protein [Microbulbifer elongatus]
MTRIAVVYFTKTDITGSLAESVATGINSVEGAESASIKINSRDIVHGRYYNEEVLSLVTACNAIIFGSPTYMGGVSAQFKAFIDATGDLWGRQAWAGKIAAGFTCGSAVNGDQGVTLQYLATLAGQHGMLWVGLDVIQSPSINRLGCQLGVTAHAPDGAAHSADLRAARYLGARVAREASRLQIFHQ